MPDDIDKQCIRLRFARSLDTYAAAATVQREMARRLVEELVAATGQRIFPRVAEAGCGTGVLTGLVERHLGYSRLFLFDLVPECARLHQERRHATFVAGDIEQLPLPGQLDLFIANAVFQWMRDLPGLLRRIAAALRPGAILAFTTFGPQNLREIAAITGKGLCYPGIPEWKQLLAAGDFQLLASAGRLQQLFFDSPIDALRHLKDTGVNATANSRPWSRRQLEDFAGQYRQRFGNPGQGSVPLTYHPLSFVARRGPIS